MVFAAIKKKGFSEGTTIYTVQNYHTSDKYNTPQGTKFPSPAYPKQGMGGGGTHTPKTAFFRKELDDQYTFPIKRAIARQFYCTFPIVERKPVPNFSEGACYLSPGVLPYHPVMV